MTAMTRVAKCFIFTRSSAGCIAALFCFTFLLLDYETTQIISLGNSPAEIVSSRDGKVGRLICVVVVDSVLFDQVN